MNPQERAFLDDIQANPADDAPRLIYADWLSDQRRPGMADEMRAQFIRAQCWGHNAEALDLMRRWPGHQCWLRVPALVPGPYSVIGMLCPEVQGDAIVFRPRGYRLAFRRGFVSMASMPLAAWQQHGPALAEVHPLEEARAGDKRPGETAIGMFDWLCREDRPGVASPGFAALPRAIYDLLDGWVEDFEPGQCRSYASAEDAIAAKSRALLAWCRQEAARRREGEAVTA